MMRQRKQYNITEGIDLQAEGKSSARFQDGNNLGIPGHAEGLNMVNKMGDSRKLWQGPTSRRAWQARGRSLHFILVPM